MVAAQLLFAFMAAGARIGGRTMPWQEVCASRFLVGAITAAIVARARGASLRMTATREAWLRSAFGTLAAAGTFFLYSLPVLPIGDAATLFATAPIFVALMSAPLLGEPIAKSHALALVLGFGGIALVAKPTFSTAGQLVIIGSATAVSSALAMVSLRRIGPNESSEAIVFHFACVGFVVMTLASAPVWRTPGLHDALVLLVAGLSAGLAQIAMTRAYALDHAARVSALAYSGVVFTRLLAIVAFGEVPNATQAIGSLLVIGSGVLLAVRGVAAHRVPQPETLGDPRSR
jgi:drug/metabolite transporter (DMT)-like permease